MPSPLIDKLTVRKRRYVYRDDSGYGFEIETFWNAHDYEGWNAEVRFVAQGMNTEEDAINQLVPALEHFLRVARDTQGKK